jgi:Kef-type K+ transport system membrane component KefB
MLCLAGIYGLGLFTLLFSLIHFVVPPFWIMVGPLVAHRIYRYLLTVVKVDTAGAMCPKCQGFLNFTYSGTANSFTQLCNQCSSQVTVRFENPQQSDDSRIFPPESVLDIGDAALGMLPGVLRSPRVLDRTFLAITFGAVILCSILLVASLLTLGHALFGETNPVGHLASHVESDRIGFVGHFLLAMVVILAVCRGLGRVFQALHQPAVMGEIVGGIVLGPTILGWLWPSASNTLFPPDVFPVLSGVAQLGIVLFMFVVGLEFDGQLIRRRLNSSVIISYASMIFPFIAGAIAALFIYRRYAPAGINFIMFGLFLGTAMSITAFPVLARILKDLGIERTPLAQVVLGSAAVDDVTSWCMLAGLTSFATGSAKAGIAIFLGIVAFFLVASTIGRRVLSRIVARAEKEYQPSHMILTLFIALASGLMTELIGIHALFGSFLVGVMIPSSSKLAKTIVPGLMPILAGLLLPSFFALTGLKTEIGLLRTPAEWLICIFIIATAAVSKVLGATLGAKVSGYNFRDSLGIGVLMNTRGLMELIVLNVGLDLGIIERRLFAIMVIMAIATTLATTPIFLWLQRGSILENQRQPATI